MAQLRAAMSRDAGVERDSQGLSRLLAVIDGLADAHGEGPVLAAARLVAAAALDRRETRGAHARKDFPTEDVVPRRTRTTLAAARPFAVAAE